MQSGFFISSSNCSNSINGRQAGSHVISLFSSVQRHVAFHRQQHQLQEFINRSFNNRVNCSTSVQFSPQHHDYSVKSLSSISSNQKQPHSPYNCEYVTGTSMPVYVLVSLFSNAHAATSCTSNADNASTGSRIGAAWAQFLSFLRIQRWSKRKLGRQRGRILQHRVQRLVANMAARGLHGNFKVTFDHDEPVASTAR